VAGQAAGKRVGLAEFQGMQAEGAAKLVATQINKHVMDMSLYWLGFGAAFGFSIAALIFFCKTLIR
jgi:hypothetical protein